MRALHAMGQRASNKLTSTLESAGNQFRVHTGPVPVHCVLSLLRGVDWSEIGERNVQSQHQWMQCQPPTATPSPISAPSATRGRISIHSRRYGYHRCDGAGRLASLDRLACAGWTGCPCEYVHIAYTSVHTCCIHTQMHGIDRGTELV